MTNGTEAKKEAEHIPVMMDEVLENLSPAPGEFFIDGTFGGGGHAREVVKRITPGGTFLGTDRDQKAIERAQRDFTEPDTRLIFRNINYSEIAEILEEEKLGRADGLLLDLGFSSLQLEEGRGFSFMKDEPLLMTYSDSDEPLHSILKGLREDEIADIIYKYSGETYSRKIAKAIYEYKRKKPIETTKELADIVKKALPTSYEHGRINPATRTFLAFRIYINKELEHLNKVLDDLPKILKSGGRVVIITFQSLEDKEVKQAFKKLEKDNLIKIVTKKPLSVNYKEAMANPRARSAKIRAAIII